jgi:hypothetical protein
MNMHKQLKKKIDNGETTLTKLLLERKKMKKFN